MSSSPAPTQVNFRADQLGDDVLKVLDSLGLKKPVLVGHSIAGEELSSIGSRYPDRVAGLIYLDAGYSYALYSPDAGDARLDAKEVQKQLREYLSDTSASGRKRTIANLLVNLPLLQKNLETEQKLDELMPTVRSEARKDHPVSEAIHDGERKYSDIPVPILAIFANPHNFANLPQLPSDKKDELIALDQARTGAQIKAFERLKNAKVVVFPDADHFVFFSNKQDVKRTMEDFLDTLKPRDH